VKKETRLRGGRRLLPSLPLATQSTLGRPNRPRHPYLPKRATRLATILCPSLALRHPCRPIYPGHPYLPKGGEVGRVSWSTGIPAVQDGSVEFVRLVASARLRDRGHESDQRAADWGRRSGQS
jgi:hypothetical protein